MGQKCFSLRWEQGYHPYRDCSCGFDRPTAKFTVSTAECRIPEKLLQTSGRGLMFEGLGWPKS